MCPRGQRTRSKLLLATVLLVAFWLVCVQQRAVTMATVYCDLSCSGPQPRALSVAKLLQTNRRVFPNRILLYRCDEETGCCNITGQVCHVKMEEKLNITYWMMGNKFIFETKYHMFDNHTECSCQTETSVN